MVLKKRKERDDPYSALRKPGSKPGYVIGSKREYNRQDEKKIIQEELDEYNENETEMVIDGI